VVGQRLVQRVAQVPAVGEVERRRLHEPALRADALEERDALELEEDRGVDARPPGRRVAVAHRLPHEREVEPPLQVAVDVALGH
jgi:hypothetical protein